jgi:hypothetical protein
MKSIHCKISWDPLDGMVWYFHSFSHYNFMWYTAEYP